MPTPVVWSERPELHAPTLKDCMYSAHLMALVYGGHTAFPFGIYTAKEREALERSDERPDETGATQADATLAVKRRYGRVMRTVSMSLATALTKVGTALTLSGENGRLSVNNRLRRWDRSFTGSHAVCVIPVGGGQSLWLDPEATNRFAGDTVQNTTILQWAYGGSSNMRFVRKDEFMVVDLQKQVADLTVKLAAAQKELTDTKIALAATEAKIVAAKAALG